MRKFKTKLLLPLITAGTLICGITASANNGIERSSNGEAFTTDRYVTDIYEGELGETVNLRPINLITTKKGQHRYISKSVTTGSDFSIAKWTLKYPDHTCIHNGYPPKENGNEWKGFSFGRSICYRSCQPGWIATCAKCGRELYAFFYATRDTISQVKSLTNGDSYISNCVDKNCNNLETGFTIMHNCDEVSWNKYTVKYYGNGADGGYLSDSAHYYNNATEYEGETVSPQSKLTKNIFCRTGYVFTGWNTKMDGNGTPFSDEEDFLNIQTKLNLGNDDQGKEIRLYAQWKPAYSTLMINPNGGSYDGETSITQRFRSTFTLDENKLTPPNGFTVLYDTQGGNHIDSTYTTMHFAGWSFSSPLYGMYNANYKQYLFGAYDTNNVFSSVTEQGWHDGCIDKVTANYAGDSFKLPEATYPNGNNPEDQKRFGGWYADPECTVFIGGAGDEFSTDRDMTLYAKWSNLHLDSEENWTANKGKGAVDLSWVQTDAADKVFKIYQKKENENWTEVKSAESISNDLGKVSQTFTRNTDNDNSEQKYIVPYSGLYNFTLAGAQGGNYQNKIGGKGGKTTGRVYLYKDEPLYVGVGSQDGKGSLYKGGTATAYASGGSASYLRVDRMSENGAFAVAGGGGGATILGNGNDAGNTKLRDTEAEIDESDDFRNGESGMAGGGGGWTGGQKGIAVLHHHIDSCYRSLAYNAGGSDTREGWGIDDTTIRKDSLNTNGNTSLSVGIYAHFWGDLHGYDISISVYNADTGALIARQSPTSSSTGPSAWEEGDGWHGTAGSLNSSGSVRFDVSSARRVNVVYYFGFTCSCHDDDDGHSREWHPGNYEFRITHTSFSGGKTKMCKYEEGDVENQYPSYGGSNGVITDNANVIVYNPNTSLDSDQLGDGYVKLEGYELGLFKDNFLNGIIASDEAAPNTPSLKRKAVEDDNDFSKTTVIWDDPGDNGTTYQHQVKSFYTETMAPMLESNITTDVMVSGVKGYRIIVDENSDTVVDVDNSSYQTENSYALTGINKNEIKYIHVAAVDGAGNIGETAHLKIGTNIGEQIYYPLETTPVVIKGLAGNVYEKNGSYFVKADGETPFYLSTNGLISEVGDAAPSYAYQINALTYKVSSNSEKQKISYYRENDRADIDKVNIDGVKKTVNGVVSTAYFNDVSFFEMSRYNNLRNMSINAAYTMDAALNNTKLRVTPQAAAYQQTDKYNTTTYTYSNDAADELNGIDLIADGKAPEISGEGYEFLKNIDNIDIGEYPDNYEITLEVKDEESGLKEFYVVIENEDNKKTKTYEGAISSDKKTGTITINIVNDDLLFQGDINFVIYASDNVSNETEESKGLGEFGLRTQITSQTSTDTIGDNGYITFKKGETGVLIVRTSGYADQIQVRFPNDFAASGFETVKNYYYEKSLSGGDTNENDLRRFGVRTEIIRFPIPYDIEEKDAYDIEITAFKNGDSITINESVGVRTLSEHQKFNISGSLLDNMRTYIIQN